MKPSFDTWTTIFLFAAVQGIFVSVALLVIKRKNRQASGLLAMLSLLFSITLIEYVLWWTGYISRLPHFFHVSAAFPFLTGPIVYYYFATVFYNYRFRWIDLLSLLPFVINIIDLSGLYFVSSEIKIGWLSGAAKMPRPMLPWPWIRIAHMMVYGIFVWTRFRPISRGQHEVKDWFNYLFAFYCIYVMSYASYFILVRFPAFNREWDYMISFSMMFTIYLLAWFGYLQPDVFRGLAVKDIIADNVQPKKYRHSSLTAQTAAGIADTVRRLMEEEKLYRDSDLRLEKLSGITGVNRHHLSQVINEKIGLSFFDYLNSLRITEAKKLLAEKNKSELNVIEIAYRVGFNNKVSFNNTFKKATGLTPTAYRKMMRDEAELRLN
jgi:AraC-like DNA-binding protein